VPLGSSVPKEAPKNPAMPIVFRWTHGGRKVYITGTFNGWMQRIPLNKSGDDFAAILNLPEGLHSYRYIVDDEWRVDPDQPTHVDNGVINNYVDVEDFPKLTGGHGLGQNKLGASSEPEIYAHEHHRFEVSKKYPPHLPPHLRYTPLNCDPHPVDPVLLPMPQHVTLNHCYFSVVGEQADVLAMGVTHRYRHKFSTVVLYKPMDVAGDGTEDMILDDDLVV
jgi:5'-AMP-activated protein kinase regulatory beta subunit